MQNHRQKSHAPKPGPIRALRRLAFVRLCVFLLLFASAIRCQNEPDQNLLAALQSGLTHLLLSTYSVNGSNGAALESGLLATINASKKTIYCVFEDIALSGPLDALHLAALRGVDVRVGLDEDHKDGPGYGMLAQYLDTTGTFPHLQVGNSGDGEVYMNICVADGTRVWASSAAPTPMDMYGATAFSIYLQSEENGIAEKFRVQLDLTTNGSFGSSKQRLNRRNHWLVGGDDVGIYFAPEEDPLEGFMTPRVRYASSSILLYASEFFSNQLDSTDVRERKDLAYEVRFAAAPTKGILTPWYAFISDEPPYEASKNSWNYLYDNGLSARITGGGPPSGGMSFLVMDGGTGGRMSFLSSHPYSKRTDSSHDGFTFVFENVRFASELTALFDTLRASSYGKPASTGLDLTTANGREIVISEINWMGGYKNDGTSSSGEYVEFFNTQDVPINVSGWNYICNNGADTTIFTFPAYTVISPKEYFLVSRNTGKFVERAHLFMTSWTTMPDDSQTCRLEDANGTVVDTAGVASTSFSVSSVHFGLDDTTNKINKSMERVDLYASGTDATNWHTNSHTSWCQNYNIVPNNIQRTFGTPGYANSTNNNGGQGLPSLDGIIFAELGDNGTKEYIELYNTTSQDVDLAQVGAYIQRDSGCSIAGGSITAKHALSGVVPAGGRLALTESANPFGIPVSQEILSGLSFTTGYCLALTKGNASFTSYNASNVVDFIGLGTSGTSAGDSGGLNSGTITSGQSISRCPDNSGAWTESRPQTPDAANNCP